MKREEEQRKTPEAPAAQARGEAEKQPLILEEWEGEHPSMMALSRYLAADEVDRAEAEAFTRHLAACPECRRLAQAMQTLEQAAAAAMEENSGSEEELEDLLDEINERSGISSYSGERLMLGNLLDWSMGEVVFRFAGRWDGNAFTLGEEGAQSLRLTSRMRGEYCRLSASFEEEVLCVEMEGRKNGWNDLPVLFLYPEEGRDFVAEVLEPEIGAGGRFFYRLELEGLRHENFEVEMKVSRYKF